MEDEHNLLVYLLGNEGWNKVLKPEIAKKVKNLYIQILDPSVERKEKTSDDFIRGQIVAYRHVIEWPQKRAMTLNMSEKEKGGEVENGG